MKSWYADGTKTTEPEEMPINKSVVKINCARWLIATVQNLQECRTTAFRESGILGAVDAFVD